MSRTGKIDLAWADQAGPGPDGKYPFRLGIGQLEELQEKCGVGPPKIAWRLGTSEWRVADVRETLRLGLIGAGMAADQAATLVRRYASDGQLLENVLPALLVINAAIQGTPDEPLGKDEGAETEGSTETETPSSPSPPSTSSAPHSDSPPTPSEA
jgi:hypothetical protein